MTILTFGTKFAQKGFFQSKTEKSHFYVRPWSLLNILNFSARGPTDTTVLETMSSFTANCRLTSTFNKNTAKYDP